jgi:hypothetical protein
MIEQNKQTETNRILKEGYTPDKKKFNEYAEYLVIFPNGSYADYREYYDN